jgi:thiamine-phosphate diphosphorylase
MTSPAAADFPIVHAVTDSGTIEQRGFLERAASIMRALGPRGALHLRSSRASGRHFYELAAFLAHVQKSSGCWLIVNDRVDIAGAVKARGAQLASHSLHVSDAKLVLRDTPIGTSIHSVQEAIEAEESGASWCVAGTVFETPSHEGREPARVEFIARVAAAVKIPIIAIGGVKPSDIAALRAAGAYGVATIRGAGWNRANLAQDDVDDVLKTRLPVPADSGFVEPVTRYISAYDSDSGSGRNDHPDGERSPAGAGT